MDEAGTKRSVLVGIAGGSASGKTTFTGLLAQELAQPPSPLSVDVVGMDRYFYRGQGPGPVFVSPSTGETMADNNHPDSADNARLIVDVDALRSAANAPDVIVLEGLMALHLPDIRERCALKVFIELEADLRALRRLLRDMRGVRGNADPEFIVRYYRECARVGHGRYVEPSREHADLILRGDAEFSRTVPFIAAVIRSLAAESATAATA